MIKIIKGPLNNQHINQVLDYWTKRADAGAHSIFLGRVRADRIGDKDTVKAIEYSSNIDLAGQILTDICKTANQRFQLIDSVIFHSVGYIPAGSLSFFILTAAGHRKTCFDALQFMVDEVKQQAPFWKKEIGHQSKPHWINEKK